VKTTHSTSKDNKDKQFVTTPIIASSRTRCCQGDTLAFIACGSACSLSAWLTEIQRLSHPRNWYLPYTAIANTRALDWSAVQVYRCANNGADQSQLVWRSVANEVRCGQPRARRRSAYGIQTDAYICNSAGVAGHLTITCVNTRSKRHNPPTVSQCH